MTTARPSADKLLVMIHDHTAFVHVVGRGSFKVSSSLKQFGIAAVESSCRRIVLDLDECVGMDSTFMGVLAGLALRLKRHNQGGIDVVNLSPRTRGLLATLGLDLVIHPYMSGETPDPYRAILGDAKLEKLDIPTASRRDTARTMLAAHEDLVRLTPENLPKFKDVLSFLREDLDAEGGMADVPSSG